MLDQIKIASPCSVNWEQMEGNDRVRYCRECKKSVFNLSAMTRRDAEALLKETNGNLCTQLYRRADGMVLTEDCPTGLQFKIARVRHRLTWTMVGALGLAASAFGQSPAILSGKVIDAAGAPVPDTLIVVNGPKASKTAQAKTDSNGSFKIETLKAGNYTVLASMRGFRQYSDEHVQLPASGEIKLKIELAVGSAGGPIFVEPEPAKRRP